MELDLLVNHAGLEGVADDLLAVVGRIDDRMRALEHELDPLRSDWVGEAQEAYGFAKRRWDTAIAEMRDLLQATSVQVRRSNDDYRAADARGARAFGG
jgi:WXG100 family type VII secretion target